jgi:hypothetical protein
MISNSESDMGVSLVLCGDPRPGPRWACFASDNCLRATHAPSQSCGARAVNEDDRRLVTLR